jgi:hypothetical protein
MSFSIDDADKFVASYIARELMKDEFRDKIVDSARERNIFLTEQTKAEIREGCGRIAHWLISIGKGGVPYVVEDDPFKETS